MYKFTNGIVVFDEDTRDKYIRAGFVLVKEEEHGKENNDEPIVKEHKRNSKDDDENTNANRRKF